MVVAVAKKHYGLGKKSSIYSIQRIIASVNKNDWQNDWLTDNVCAL